MNDRDLLMGFKRCGEEIRDLRKRNELMSAELRMADRILNAVNNHREPQTGGCYGEDILRNIRETELFLEGRIMKNETAKRDAAVDGNCHEEKK